MIELSLAEVAAAVGGSLHRAEGTEVVTGSVEFDSREIVDGGLFVAIPGERVDGHAFAETAVAAGAVGALVAREVDVPCVVVPAVSEAHARAMALAGDTDGSGAAVLAALAALARYVVDRLPGLWVVGVTGSSGKTSTKDLIAQLLEPMGPTVAPPGSFNNELGHPWTVLRANENTRYLVLELSARGPGHIAALCRTAPPSIGAVLNVGSAHIGEFGSQEAVAETKGELVEALPADGLAVLNVDDPLVAAMARRSTARVVGVGEAANADIRAVEVELDARARPRFRLCVGQRDVAVQLPLYGEHQVGNALSAAAVVLELGATLEEVAHRLSSVRQLSGRRMEVRSTGDGVTVVNDSYNANPESVRAALKSLASMRASGLTVDQHGERVGNQHGERVDDQPRRSWAVLGVMGELGDSSDQAHDEIGRLAVRLNIDRLIVVGQNARRMYQGAALEGSWSGEAVLVDDVEQAISLLRGQVRPSDIVLVKASKVAALWRVADALLAPGHERAGGDAR